MSCSSNLIGVNKLWLCPITGDSFNYFVKNGEVKITGYTFTQFQSDTISFSQSRTGDAKGTYFAQKLEISVPNIAEDSVEDLDGNSYVVIFTDNNDNTFITGFENGYSIDKEEATDGIDSNRIDFNLKQSSYERVQVLSPESQITYVNA